MKTFFAGLLGMLLVASSCSDHQPGNNSDSSKQPISKRNDPEPVPHTAPSFYKRYEGTIAGQPVVMYLEKDDTNFNGYYYYSKVGRPITLAGMTGNNKDSLVLQEYIPGNAYGDTEVPELHCIFSGENLTGEWITKQKKHPVSLKEKYPQGSYSFTMKKFRDTAMLVNDPKSPFATSSHKIPFALGQGDDAAWLNEQIRIALDSGSADATVETIVGKMEDSFFANYRRDNAEEVNNYNSVEGYPFRLNYDESVNYSIRYNENGLVTIEAAVYSYWGGAHGNYGSLYTSYDVANRKVLKLQDIISVDTASLQRILEQQLRVDYKIAASKPLTEVLFDPHLAITDNFYLSEKGLGFVYNPYEVAAYAVGQIELFVPYSILSGYLTPEFKKRMKR